MGWTSLAGRGLSSLLRWGDSPHCGRGVAYRHRRTVRTLQMVRHLQRCSKTKHWTSSAAPRRLQLPQSSVERSLPLYPLPAIATTLANTTIRDPRLGDDAIISTEAGGHFCPKSLTCARWLPSNHQRSLRYLAPPQASQADSWAFRRAERITL